MPDQRSRKAVWILGAGASRSHSHGRFPTTDTFLREAMDVFRRDSTRGDGWELLSLRQYVTQRFDRDLADDKELPDLESLLTFIDTDFEARPSPFLALARAGAVNLIRETLTALHQALHGVASEYDDLATRLLPCDSVITFNWDVLLDDTLGRLQLVDRQGPVPQNHNQYGNFVDAFTGIGAGAISQLSPSPPVDPASTSEGIFLKLHGSVDWFTCANPLCRNVHLVFPLSAEARKWPCASCLEELVGVLVPPVLSKRFRDSAVLRRLWNRATVELSQAEDILVWGYSFPPSDFQSRWLLSHAKADNLRRLVVINPVISGKEDFLTSRHDVFIQSLRAGLGHVLQSCTIDLYEFYDDYIAGLPLAVKYPDLHWSTDVVRRLRGLTSA